jgi:HAD superfamily hydrolase (TIGR01509 family)
VLLDIDGTLLDTNHLHTVSWWRAFRRLGLTFPMSRIHRLIGMGGDKLVPELAGHEVPGADDAYAEEFERWHDEVLCLPGARDLVATIDAAGVAAVLASSAKADDLEHFRKVLDLEDHLAGATSSGDADESKPDAELFDVAIERYELDRTRTLVIGDTGWDGEAARRAGLPFIGVQTGGWTERDLIDARATEVHPNAGSIARDLAGVLDRTWGPGWADRAGSP